MNRMPWSLLKYCVGKTCISRDNNLLLVLLLPQSYSWVQLLLQRWQRGHWLPSCQMPKAAFHGFVLPQVPGVLGTLYSFSQFLWGFWGVVGFLFWSGFFMDSVSLEACYFQELKWYYEILHFRRVGILWWWWFLGFVFSVFKQILGAMPFIKEKCLLSNWQEKYRL